MNSSRPVLRPHADELFNKMTAVAASFAITCVLLYFFYSDPPFDGTHFLIGRDFVNTWMGGRAALSGQPEPWFDFDIYNAALRDNFGPDFPQHSWSYPPTLFLFTWPLGFLPYLAGYAAWTLVGFAVYMLAAAQGERRADRLLMLVVSPAVVVNLIGGQNGFFTAALLIGGLSLLDRRPFVAGLLFGLLTIKPQLGLLLPLMLALTHQWRCIASATVTALMLAGITTAIYGPDVWVAYLDDGLSMQKKIVLDFDGFYRLMMPTAFMNVRLAGLPLAWAWTVQAVVSLPPWPPWCGPIGGDAIRCCPPPFL